MDQEIPEKMEKSCCLNTLKYPHKPIKNLVIRLIYSPSVSFHLKNIFLSRQEAKRNWNFFQGKSTNSRGFNKSHKRNDLWQLKHNLKFILSSCQIFPWTFKSSGFWHQICSLKKTSHIQCNYFIKVISKQLYCIEDLS